MTTGECAYCLRRKPLMSGTQVCVACSHVAMMVTGSLHFIRKEVSQNGWNKLESKQQIGDISRQDTARTTSGK